MGLDCSADTGLSPLTSPDTATRRLIMQKARRHASLRSDRLWAHGFRNCFTLLREVLFTFPSRYSSTIGLAMCLALPDGPGRFSPDCTCPGILRVTLGICRYRKIRDYHPLWWNGPVPSYDISIILSCAPTTPAERPEPPRWFGLFPGRSPLLGESFDYFLFLQVLRCFSSLRRPPFI